METPVPALEEREPRTGSAVELKRYYPKLLLGRLLGCSYQCRHVRGAATSSQCAVAGGECVYHDNLLCTTLRRCSAPSPLNYAMRAGRARKMGRKMSVMFT